MLQRAQVRHLRRGAAEVIGWQNLAQGFTVAARPNRQIIVPARSVTGVLRAIVY